jgi:ketosteroid isomerase-like protein
VPSSPKLELVRSIVADWERGDFGSVGWAAAEIEFVIADGPEPVGLRGLRATLEYWRKLPSSWKGYRLVGDGYRELDEERVLVIVHAKGRRDGAELARHGAGGAVVFTVRAGRVTRLVAYFDRDRAFADLGLGE